MRVCFEYENLMNLEEGDYYVYLWEPHQKNPWRDIFPEEHGIEADINSILKKVEGTDFRVMYLNNDKDVHKIYYEIRRAPLEIVAFKEGPSEKHGPFKIKSTGIDTIISLFSQDGE